MQAKLFAVESLERVQEVGPQLGDFRRLQSDGNVLVVPFANDAALFDLLKKSHKVSLRPVLINTTGFKRFVEHMIMADAVLEEIEIEPTPLSHEVDELTDALVEYQRTGILARVWSSLFGILTQHNAYVDSVRIRIPNPNPGSPPRNIRVSLFADGVLMAGNGDDTLRVLDAALCQATQ